VKRHKLEAVGAAVVAAAIMVPLIVVVSASFILLVPFVMTIWLFAFLPFWRRRYRRTAYEAPHWQLHPE
jgi:hypothetical protein